MELAKAKNADRFQQRREQTRRELLAAARRVLAANGYHRTKVADIARTADVGVGTFYLYYPTKEALFIELVEDLVRLLKGEIDTVTKNCVDPLLRVRVRNEVFFRFAQQHRDLFRIVFGHGREFHDVVRNAQKLFIAEIAENVRQGIEAGVFRASNPELLAYAIIGTALEAVNWWVEGNSMSVEEIAESIFQFIAHGLCDHQPAS